APRAVEVDGARDELLARPALARDQDRQLALDDAVELLEHAAHRVRRADDRRVVEAPALAAQLGPHDGQLRLPIAHLAPEQLVQSLDLSLRGRELAVLLRQVR